MNFLMMLVSDEVIFAQKITFFDSIMRILNKNLVGKSPQ